MGMSYGTHEREKEWMQSFGRGRKRQLGRLKVYGKIILEWTLEK
jgi:hypothetical protein